MDPVTGQHSYGVYNGPDGNLLSGGVAKLTDVSISTRGAAMHGVVTGAGGSTTLVGTNVLTAGPGANGVYTYAGGVTNISGGSVTTTGAGGVDLFASGAYSKISASDVTLSAALGPDAHAVFAYQGGEVDLSGGSARTTGNTLYVAGVYGGGTVDLNGTAISATGVGSGGVFVNGTGGVLNATDVSISTQGGEDTSTGANADGAYNGAYLPGGLTSGGLMSLTNSKITTSGAGAAGVVTQNGGVTNVSGGSVATSGQDADALVVTGLDSKANLTGAGSFSTAGNGAIGLAANQGGIISATGSTSITTAGGVSPSTGFAATGVDADGAGSQINLASAKITTSGPGAFGLVASDVSASGSAGKITVTGPLAVSTTNASGTAVALQGNGATITATGGGTIAAAGTAIAFLGGTGQSATFDNFAIGNLSGDLVFADPSIATLNFSNTTANAGNNNLLNASGASAVTLNANASMLTGAIRTDATSTTNVNLANGTTWNLTAASTVTNLNVTHSIIVFAPPGTGGAFKTLTVNNYAGNGANIAMNVALSGSNSGGDQIIINGGKATGSTLLTINNVGGLGGQTSGNGIPLVVATNGGSVASGAFSLANTPMVGGFKYTLEETDNSYFLVSSPTATIAGVTNSVNNVAKAQQSQMITIGCWVRSCLARPSRSAARAAEEGSLRLVHSPSAAAADGASATQRR